MQAVATRFLGPGRVVFSIVPEGKKELPRSGGGDPMTARAGAPLTPPDRHRGPGGPALAHRADRSGPPAPGPARPLTLPPIEHHALSNGVPVLLVGVHEVPVVEVVWSSPPAPPPTRGAGGSGPHDRRDARRGRRREGRPGPRRRRGFPRRAIETGSRWDASTVRLRVPVARLADALPLMADVALRPDFAEEELERLRKEALTRLLQARDQPRSIASRALAEAVFARRVASVARRPATRRRSPRSPSPTCAVPRAAATRRRRHPRGRGRRDRAALRALEKAFGGWTAPAETRCPEGGPSAAGEGTLGPARRQARRRAVGDPARASRPSWDDPRYHAGRGHEHAPRGLVHLATQRQPPRAARLHLRRRLRLEGYRVGALPGRRRRPDRQAHRRGGHRVPQGARAASALPPTAEEVERARSYAALGYAGEFETTGQIAGQIAQQFIYELPEDFFNSFVPTALAVDAEQMAQVATAHIALDSLAIIVVGDRAAIEEPLKKLELGPIRNLSIEDVMGTRAEDQLTWSNTPRL